MRHNHNQHTTPFDKGAITVEVAHRLADYSTIKQTIKKVQKRKARQHSKKVCQVVE